MLANAQSRCLFIGLFFLLALGSLANKSHGQDSGIDPLIARLKQSQPAPKVSAARRLAELGTSASSAVPTLIQNLQDSSPDVRVVAAYALARVSTDCSASIAALQPLLGDNSEHVRYSAQWSTSQLAGQIPMSLTESERSKTIAILEKSLELVKQFEHQSRHRAVVESVIGILQSQIVPVAEPLSPDPPTAQALQPAQLSPTQSATSAAFGSPIDASDLVVGLYEPNDMISRMQVIRRLRDHQRFPAEIRKNVLKFEATQLDSILFEYAVAIWGETIQADLQNTIRDIAVDGNLPDYAHRFVEQIKCSNQETLDQLKAWCQDVRQPYEIRLAAINTLSCSSFDRPACVELLSNLLSDTDVQQDAAEALYNMGVEAKSAEAKLVAALTSSGDESFQMIGVRALAQISAGSPTTVQSILGWLTSTPADSVVLPILIDACAQIGEPAVQAIPALQANLKNPNPDVRLSAAKALQRFGSRAEVALQELVGILSSDTEEQYIKIAAAKALGSIGPNGVQAIINAVLSRTDPVSQATWLRALSVSGTTSMEAQSLCANILNNSSSPTEVRVAAAGALGAMGKAAQSLILRVLYNCQPNEDPQLQASCLLAAAQIDPAATKSAAILGLESPYKLVRANAAYAMHLCGESRVAFDTLLSMLNESDSDVVIKQALRELGSSITPWVADQAENMQLDDIQRLACCELACEVPQPDWNRLLMLVDEPQLGHEFYILLSSYWHPNIASDIELQLDALDILLALTQSNKVSEIGRARLASLLSPDGLGGGEEESWGGLALSQQAAVEVLQRADEADNVAAVVAEESAESSNEPAKRLQPKAAIDSLAGAGVPMGEPTNQISNARSREVEVFYGTNRQRESMNAVMKQIIAAILIVTIGSILALAFVAISFYHRGRRLLSLASVLALAVFGSFGVFAAKQLGRNPLEAKVAYSHQLAKKIEYGKCLVSIPPNHQPGMVESPMLLKLQLVADPNNHVVLEKVAQLSRDDFVASIKQAQATKGKNLLVFIHGYNVSFDDAAKRTAQMAFDLEFPGASIFYSWPSQADWYGYKTDVRQIEESVTHIKSFLEDLAQNSGADTINLVAHSMGNVGLTAALQQISAPEGRPMFNQVVLAAPDVDAEVFKRDIAPNIVSKARRTTLYTSKTDLALIASRFFNNGSSRLGDSGAEVVTFPGIETIDATTVDSSLLGHSYYGSNISVLTDVGRLLRNEPIAGRAYLRSVVDGDANYWTFDPVLISRSSELLDSMMKK